MQEIWKTIEEYPKYEISNFGRVRTFYSNFPPYQKLDEPRFKVIQKNAKGYPIQSFFHNGKGCTKAIHRLVAKAFIPNPDNKPCVNHIDGVVDNNVYTNLEWCTYKENFHHARDVLNKNPVGTKSPNAKLTKDQVIEILKSKEGCTTLSRRYGVHKSVILGVRHRRKYKDVVID